MAENFTLLIIDCQNDFTSPDGVMYIPKSEKIIPNICEFINKHKDNISRVLLARDNHPKNHCSFRGHGGGWPQHCVENTWGAEINPNIIDVLEKQKIDYFILNKGEVADFEEYSTSSYSKFMDGTFVLQTATDAKRVIDDNIVVCGATGDFCVKETLLDLCKYIPKIQVHVFIDGIISIDDNTQIMNLLEDKTDIQIM